MMTIFVRNDSPRITAGLISCAFFALGLACSDDSNVTYTAPGTAGATVTPINRGTGTLLPDVPGGAAGMNNGNAGAPGLGIAGAAGSGAGSGGLPGTGGAPGFGTAGSFGYASGGAAGTSDIGSAGVAGTDGTAGTYGFAGMGGESDSLP